MSPTVSEQIRQRREDAEHDEMLRWLREERPKALVLLREGAQLDRATPRAFEAWQSRVRTFLRITRTTPEEYR